jgi:hypothetical protein
MGLRELEEPVPSQVEGFEVGRRDDRGEPRRSLDIRLFDHLEADHLTLDQSRSTASSRVTHLTYSVTKRRSAVPQGEVPVGQVGSSTGSGA